MFEIFIHLFMKAKIIKAKSENTIIIATILIEYRYFSAYRNAFQKKIQA